MALAYDIEEEGYIQNYQRLGPAGNGAINKFWKFLEFLYKKISRIILFTFLNNKL